MASISAPDLRALLEVLQEHDLLDRAARLKVGDIELDLISSTNAAPALNAEQLAAALDLDADLPEDPRAKVERDIADATKKALGR